MVCVNLNLSSENDPQVVMFSNTHRSTSWRSLPSGSAWSRPDKPAPHRTPPGLYQWCRRTQLCCRTAYDPRPDPETTTTLLLSVSYHSVDSNIQRVLQLYLYSFCFHFHFTSSFSHFYYLKKKKKSIRFHLFFSVSVILVLKLILFNSKATFVFFNLIFILFQLNETR